jgi:hypothetical protein
VISLGCSGSPQCAQVTSAWVSSCPQRSWREAFDAAPVPAQRAAPVATFG